MSIDGDALQLLCDRVEGNLLAAVQEVEKLKLLVTDSQITARNVTEAVSDNARYTVFELADTALRGDAAASLRMLHGLRGEGTEPTGGAVGPGPRDSHPSRSTTGLRQGPGRQQALSARRVWQNRIPLLQAALARHNTDSTVPHAGAGAAGRWQHQGFCRRQALGQPGIPCSVALRCQRLIKAGSMSLP